MADTTKNGPFLLLALLAVVAGAIVGRGIADRAGARRPGHSTMEDSARSSIVPLESQQGQVDMRQGDATRRILHEIRPSPPTEQTKADQPNWAFSKDTSAEFEQLLIDDGSGTMEFLKRIHATLYGKETTKAGRACMHKPNYAGPAVVTLRVNVRYDGNGSGAVEEVALGEVENGTALDGGTLVCLQQVLERAFSAEKTRSHTSEDRSRFVGSIGLRFHAP